MGGGRGLAVDVGSFPPQTEGATNKRSTLICWSCCHGLKQGASRRLFFFFFFFFFFCCCHDGITNLGLIARTTTGALSNLELDETVFEDLLQLPPNMALVKVRLFSRARPRVVCACVCVPRFVVAMHRPTGSPCIPPRNPATVRDF